VALVGHSHSGKSSLAEWIMFNGNVLFKRPNSKESCLDSDPVEANRHSSVFSHFVRVPNGQYLLELTDTPWGDFPSDAAAATNGADAAVLLVSAADSVQAGTNTAFYHCRKSGIKLLLALSKMDRPFVQVEQVLSAVEDNLGVKPQPLQVPIGQGETFQGVKSLLQLDSQTGTVTKNAAVEDDPDLEAAWTELEEAVAMTDDDLLVEYLEHGQLESSQIVAGLQTAVRQDKILPVVFTAAEQDLGVKELMDALVAVLPNPIEMRQEAIRAACESEHGKCGMEPGVEAGFAARVLHTTIDSFGSLSVLRVISNGRSSADDAVFDSLPHEAVVLRTGEKIKMPSASTSFGLCGKDRQPLADGVQVVPGDVIAVPKLSEKVQTNDILTLPGAVQEEESEISLEAATNVLTPLSRLAEEVPLMATATISVPDATGGGKKSKGKSGSGGGDEKLLTALRALSREDLALRVETSSSGLLLVRCMSSDHLNIVAAKLKDRYGLDVELGQPPVQYRETLAKAVKNIEGRHKKQSGGSGQFGVCYINMEPIEEGKGIEFESQIKGGVISKPFISSVEKGVREQLESGGPLGYPVTDVRVTLIDGKMHSVDSKDIAFQSAGRLAVKAALEKGGTNLLQPMEEVTFQIDEALQGEISAIVARGDGYVTATNAPDSQGHLEVEAVLPSASISEVSDVLRAASGGEAQYTSSFSHYQPVVGGGTATNVLQP